MRIDELNYNNISIEIVQEVIRANPNQIVEIIDKIISFGRNFSRLENIISFIPNEYHSDLAKYYIKKQKIKEVAENLYLLKNLDLEVGLALASSKKDDLYIPLLNNIENFPKENHEEIVLTFIKTNTGRKFFIYLQNTEFDRFYFEDFNKFILKVIELGEHRAVAFEVLQFVPVKDLDLQIAKELIKSGDRDVLDIVLRKLKNEDSKFKIMNKKTPLPELENYTINEIIKHPKLLSSLC